MKKISVISSILLASVSTGAMAGNFYIGPSLFIEHVSASHSSYTGLHPRLALGYGNMWGEYYLAGELNAVPFSSVMSNSNSNGAVSAKITRGFGASIIPGMMISDNVMGFLRFGVMNSKFPGPNLSRTGGMLGAGLEVPINTSWNFRIEYLFTAYRSISGLGSPKNNELGVGAIYKFGN